MSNYIQVLKRLERERGDGTVPAREAGRPGGGDVPGARRQERDRSPATGESAPAASSREVAVEPSAPAARTAAPAGSAAPVLVSSPAVAPLGTPAERTPDLHAPRPLPAAVAPGIVTLFDNIRALATNRPMRTLVFAGAVAGDGVAAVTSGLAAHAERHGMRVLAADLRKVGGRATLIARPVAWRRPAPLAGSGDGTLGVELESGVPATELDGWLERTAPGAQLVIVSGPPLADSIDAALLACACDGLVIVAESEVTDRSALQIAAERARVAGCHTLGVVMHGTQDHLPDWMRRLMGGAQSRSPRKD